MASKAWKTGGLKPPIFSFQLLQGDEQRLACQRIAGLAVCSCGFRVEADKQRDGLSSGVADEQSAIAIHAIFTSEVAAVPLHHVNIVRPLFGREAERRIFAFIVKRIAADQDYRLAISLGAFNLRVQ